jgi:histidine ammonia-lyase
MRRIGTPTEAEAAAPAAPTLVVGRSPLRVEDVAALAHGRARVALDPDPAYRGHLEEGRRLMEKALSAEQAIYGVTTGVGASVGNAIPEALRLEFPRNLLRFHGCGTGRILDEPLAAAVVAVRLASLSRGYSGVRPILLERLCQLLNRRILPRIPEEGSVGASGDLTPLSYLAATLVGEREATFRGRVLPAAEALAEAGLQPLELLPKESLAIMNGTAAMTALACMAFVRARRLARAAAALTALASEAVRGNPQHFHPRIAELRPHPGQRRCAAWIWADLEEGASSAGPPARLQDPYSLRCTPQVVGVLVDALEAARPVLETEVNSANDNPLVDPEYGVVWHGGNFYGGHVCFAMDGLKTAVANVADLLDRQLVLLCQPATSGGLPENLVAVAGERRFAHHGFKAMQIGASALTAEALKLTMPASAFSRSTESHNQDKVSMGTIAARDALRVLELTETVAAMLTLAVCQALELREGSPRTARGHALLDAVRSRIPALGDDRRQDVDIAGVLDELRADALPFGPWDLPGEAQAARRAASQETQPE